MKDNLCAHCMHAVQVAYCGFFCEETGYTENKTVTERCDTFEPDALSDMTNQIKRALIEAYPKSATFTAVKHGRWIPTEYDSYADGNPVYDAFECSECGHEHSGEEDTLTAFCPDCGADMREKGAGNG